MMFTLIMVSSGILWLLAYILIIKRGFQDKTYGMPLVAICGNISWEFIFSFIYPHLAPHVYVNIFAFSLDLIILFQLLFIWQNEFKGLSKKFFYTIFISIFVISFYIMFVITYRYRDLYGVKLAYGQNLLMSILFITMILNRNSIKGQSIYIAILKMLGTALTSVAFYIFFAREFYENSIFWSILYTLIFLFDIIYIFIFYQKSRKQAINPWTRA